MNLVEVLSKRIMSRLHNTSPKTGPEKIANIDHCLEHLREKVYCPHLNSALIARGNEVAVYDLCYTLCQAFQMGLPSVSMGDGQGTMMRWLNEKIKDSGIAITNFNEDFKTGAVFCALVNAYEKDAIPVKKISSKASKKNFTLAFTFAETKWQIPQILDADDIMKKPDTLSILLYIAFFKAMDKKDEPDIMAQISQMKKASSMRIDTQKIEPAPETRAQTARETETPEKAKAVAEKASDSPGLQRAQTARDSPSKRPTSMTEDELKKKGSGSVGRTPGVGRSQTSAGLAAKKSSSGKAPDSPSFHKSPHKGKQPADSPTTAQVSFSDLEKLVSEGLIKVENLGTIWDYLSASDKSSYAFPKIAPPTQHQPGIGSAGPLLTGSPGSPYAAGGGMMTNSYGSPMMTNSGMMNSMLTNSYGIPGFSTNNLGSGPGLGNGPLSPKGNNLSAAPSGTLSPRAAAPPSGTLSPRATAPPSSTLSPRTMKMTQSDAQEAAAIQVQPITDDIIASMKPHRLVELRVTLPNYISRDLIQVKGTSKQGGTLAFNTLDVGNGVFLIQFVPRAAGNHAIAVSYKSKQVAGSPLGFVIPDPPVPVQVASLEDVAQLSKLMVPPSNALPGVPLTVHFTTVFNHKFEPYPITKDNMQIEINGPCPTMGHISQVLPDKSFHLTFVPPIVGEYLIQIKVAGRPIFPAPVMISARGYLDSRTSAASELDQLLSGMGY